MNLFDSIGCLLRLTPVAGFLLLVWLWFDARAALGRLRGDFAVKWILASISTGAFCVVLTEAAGACRRLQPGFCAAAWIFADVIMLALVFRGKNRQISQVVEPRRKAPEPSKVASGLGWAAALFLLVLGVFSLATPTTVWDAQTFHMPRVMHWLQDRSVQSYATNIPRQIEYPPGVEMAIAQLMLLAGNDLPANLPEWWALVTAAILAAFLARELLVENPLRSGAIPPAAIEVGAAFAAVLVVTAPGAAPQAMSSLCDLVAAMWVMGAIALGWLFFKSPQNHYYSVGAGAALALAFSAKVTMGLYAAPFLALLVFALVKCRRFRALLQIAAIAAILMLVINGNWMRRNYQLMGNPIGSKATFDLSASRHPTPRAVAANVLRNLSFYTRTPFQGVTTVLNSFFVVGMDVLDESWDDPSWTFQNLGFEPPVKSRISDGDGLGNCYALWLLAAAGAVFFVRCKLRSSPGVYLLGLAASFILFSALLRWDPWHDRLQIAYFILAAPAVAALAAIGFRVWITVCLAVFLLCNAALTICLNPTFPAFSALCDAQPREALYFAVRPELYETTRTLAEDIVQSGCSNVLLKIGDDTWEYPLWVLLKDRKFQGTVNHTLVDNESAALPSFSAAAPQTVILAMHADHAAIPPPFALEISYDTWRAFYRASAPEQRARMTGDHATLKYTFARPGVLSVRFEPRNAEGGLATNGNLEITVKNIETNQFLTVDTLRTNLPLAAVTSFFCPVLAPSMTILLTNVTPANAIAALAKLEVTEQVPAGSGNRP